MALVTRNTLSRGRLPAFFTTLGISTGVATHALLWAVGLSAIISRSATLYEGLKIVGAAYLVFLGIRSLLGLEKEKTPPTLQQGQEAPINEYDSKQENRVLQRSFSQGLLTNVLNPKVALFYLTFLPQFISASDPVIPKALMLAGIHITLGLLWLTTYAYMVDRLSALFMQASTRRKIERVTGAMLIALGLRLAWERR